MSIKGQNSLKSPLFDSFSILLVYVLTIQSHVLFVRESGVGKVDPRAMNTVVISFRIYSSKVNSIFGNKVR